jgi:hypothetical protein
MEPWIGLARPEVILIVIYLANLLLEQDRTEAGIESTDTLVLQHLAEASNQAVGIGGLRHETDTGGLKRAQGDISEELGEGGRGEVDGGTVLTGSLVSEDVNGLLLEQLITSELESALKEVSCCGRTETSQECAGTVLSNSLAETSNEALVVGGGVELYSGLDAVIASR